MESVKLIDIKIDQKTIDDVVSVLKSGIIASGPKVKELEAKFCKYVGSENAIAVNSGTAALHAALFAANINEGDEVITTPFTFIATANSIKMVGAKPIFCDIDDSFNIDPNKIESKITNNTKAILTVNLFGNPCNYNRLRKICSKHNLILIEDAAQSIGAKQNGISSGNLADISCFSFYATKNLMCGEGGIITTNNDLFADRAKQFRHHGQTEKRRYAYLHLGYNYRMTDVAAVIALNQLEKIEAITKKRIENAKYYAKELSKIGGLKLPVVEKNNKHSFHQYSILLTDNNQREKMKAHLAKHNIQSAIYYPLSLNKVEHLNSSDKNFPVSEDFSSRILSIPIQPNLNQKELKFVCKTIKDFFNET